MIEGGPWQGRGWARACCSQEGVCILVVPVVHWVQWACELACAS